MRTIELRVRCEGQTEQRFVAQVIGPHLRGFGVHTRAETLLPTGGGVVTWNRLRHELKREVGRSRPHQFVTTMVDLYALRGYPGAERRAGETSAERVDRIETELVQSLPSSQFLPYIQLHEFEALLFVDLDELSSYFVEDEASGVPERLKRAIGSTPPEDVDDGEHTAPSKRILRELPRYRFEKAIAGPIIAERIGLPRLREACPHFDGWVARLERLAETRS